jgi:hypothetical protein
MSSATKKDMAVKKTLKNNLRPSDIEDKIRQSNSNNNNNKKLERKLSLKSPELQRLPKEHQGKPQ